MRHRSQARLATRVLTEATHLIRPVMLYDVVIS